MSPETIQEKKEEIQSHTLDALKEYLGTDVKEIDVLTTAQIGVLYNRARLGMQFEREMNVSRRAHEMNFNRTGKLITEVKEELKNDLKKTIPQ